MINRYRGTCNKCKQKFVFRAVVPLASTEGMRFCCPGCRIELSCKLSLDYSVPRMDLSPSGFKLDGEIESISEPVVTVATDLPVHKRDHVNTLDKGGSPFLLLHQEMGGAIFLAWKQKVDLLQHLRETSFSDIKQLVDYARAGNWAMVASCLETIYDEDPPDNTTSTIYTCYRVLSTMYVPLIEYSERIEIMDEYYSFLNDCMDNKKEEYRILLESWSQLPLYRGFRTKTLSLLLRVLEHFDAFIVGFLYNEMPQSLKQKIDDYRIFRDDYTTIKTMYQDLFELSSQSLIFLGAVVNLSKRGDSEHYATGVRSLKAFIKKTAFERFKILSELPKLAALLGAVNRPMRNSIGHFSADYEPCTGNIRYDDGSIENYIVFLGKFLAAVNALSFILIFIEKTDIDMERLGILIPTGLENC